MEFFISTLILISGKLHFLQRTKYLRKISFLAFKILCEKKIMSCVFIVHDHSRIVVPLALLSPSWLRDRFSLKKKPVALRRVEDDVEIPFCGKLSERNSWLAGRETTLIMAANTDQKVKKRIYKEQPIKEDPMEEEKTTTKEPIVLRKFFQ